VKPELAEKLERLGDGIRQFQRVIVAYSGGVDSSLVLEVAHQVLGADCRGVLARSPSLPQSELAAALEVAGNRNLPVEVIATTEVELPGYQANGPDRCYFCKTELYGAMASMARERRAVALDGFNRDDRADWRPGRKAAVELGVRSPLDEVGMGKEEVRLAARELGLPNWDKPAAACLSSRVAYGVPVSRETLARIESAESVLRAEGFRQVRVRDDGLAATIEVEPEATDRLLEEHSLWERVDASLRDLGYERVAVDRRGYRRGSLNMSHLAGG
jgi:uncharacterized protein